MYTDVYIYCIFYIFMLTTNYLYYNAYVLMETHVYNYVINIYIKQNHE